MAGVWVRWQSQGELITQYELNPAYPEGRLLCTQPCRVYVFACLHVEGRRISRNASSHRISGPRSITCATPPISLTKKRPLLPRPISSLPRFAIRQEILAVDCVQGRSCSKAATLDNFSCKSSWLTPRQDPVTRKTKETATAFSRFYHIHLCSHSPLGKALSAWNCPAFVGEPAPAHQLLLLYAVSLDGLVRAHEGGGLNLWQSALMFLRAWALNKSWQIIGDEAKSWPWYAWG